MLLWMTAISVASVQVFGVRPNANHVILTKFLEIKYKRFLFRSYFIHSFLQNRIEVMNTK